MCPDASAVVSLSLLSLKARKGDQTNIVLAVNLLGRGSATGSGEGKDGWLDAEGRSRSIQGRWE